MSPPAFRLYSLPLELVREIVQVAATPRTDGFTAGPQYADAVSLARVSYAMRQLAMPHLLHTVTLRSHESVAAFFSALKMQHEFNKNQDRLSFSYPRSIRRFWCSEFYEPLMQSTEHYDYILLFDVFSQAQQIGFHIRGIELLHEVLASRDYRDGIPSHFCKALTIAGAGTMRWNPMTATSTGAKFLEHITHLTILRPDTNFSSSQSNPDDISCLIPESARAIPFGLMRSLTHFALCLNVKGVDVASVLVVINSGHGVCGGEGIKRNLFGRGPMSLSNARVVKLFAPNGCGDNPAMVTCSGWETTFYEQGQAMWNVAARSIVF